ncbi:MAG: hypothetical protein KC413_18720, partial [Anaerolineales bacterium]|nr:hypothetical protein [Anaerolineales bacterium]
MGIHLLLDDGRNHWPPAIWPEHLAYARELVGDWGYVTQLVRLDDLDSDKWQLFMDLCADLHLTPILRLATTYDQTAGWWLAPPPDDNNSSYTHVARQYAQFVAALRWPTTAHYVIVGNEPNHGDEWGERPFPAQYARFLLDTSVALKTADPHARVLNAPLDLYTPHSGSQPFNNGLWYMDAAAFLDDMIAAYPNIFTYLDAWASHLYPASFTAPPWQQTFQFDRLHDAVALPLTQPPPAVWNRGINGYEWELWWLSQHHITPLPIFITETGWRHQEAAQSSLDTGSYPDAALVQTYLDLAWWGNGNGRYPTYPSSGWTPWMTDTRVVAVTPFALN